MEFEMKSTKDRIVNVSEPKQLQSFFSRLSLLEKDFSPEAYMEKFAALKENHQKVDMVYGDLLKFDPFLHSFPEFIKDYKNDKKATEDREAGNKYFATGNFQEALIMYSRSISNAKTKQILALAFANRSAALMKLNLIEECISDISRALENNYPDHLKPKVEARRVQAEKLLKSAPKLHKTQPEIPESERNPKIDSAKNCVEIQNSKNFGRCVVATRDIPVGEVIAFEKPFACLLSRETLIHCHECLQVYYNPIPCDNCTYALYCSETCKSQAFNNYHKFECPVLKTLTQWGVDKLKLLALKIGFMVKQLKKNDKSPGAKTDYYRSDRFKEFLKLNPHTEKRLKCDILLRALYTAKFFHLIKNYTHFFDDPNFSRKELENSFKSVVLRSMQIVPINNCEVGESAPDKHGKYSVTEVGVAVYPFLSLLNHACCQNVNRHYYGRNVALVAISPIEKGEQCFISYGPQYMSYKKEDRQNHLRNVYYFDCKCKACIENWSPATLPTFMTSDLALVYGMSRLQFHYVLEQIYKGNSQVIDEYYNHFLKQLERLKKTRPSKDYRFVQEIIYQCLNMRANKRLF